MAYKHFLSLLKKHLIISIKKGDRADEGNSYRGLSIPYVSLGDLQKAIEYNEKQLKIAIKSLIGPEKEEPLQISVLPTCHWVTSEKPFSIIKNT